MGLFEFFHLKGGFISAGRTARASSSDLPHSRAASLSPLLHTCVPSQSIRNNPFPPPNQENITPLSFQCYWAGQSNKRGVLQANIPATKGAVW